MMGEDDNGGVVVVPVKNCGKDAPGAVKDGCGNWFVPDFSNCYWTGKFMVENLTCGCGCPADVMKLIVCYLEIVEAGIESRKSLEDQHKACGGEAAWWLLAYVADQFGWTEHGTTVNWAWITDKGVQTLKGLRNLLGEEEPSRA